MYWNKFQEGLVTNMHVLIGPKIRFSCNFSGLGDQAPSLYSLPDQYLFDYNETKLIQRISLISNLATIEMIAN